MLKTYDHHRVKKDKYYFEDNDKKGIKIINRFQFIMKKYKSIEELLDSFDMYSSCVAYDGHDVYFTKNSHYAYKYMVNLVREDKYTYMFDSRISKYLSYGFDIAFPTENIKDIEEFKIKFEATDHFVQLCSLNILINKIIKNKIIIEHDSHIKKLLESINELEKKCKNEGKTELYRSSVFCSLTSILRCMCINKIKYKFSENNLLPDKENVFEFKVGKHELQFGDTISIDVMQNLWYRDNKRVLKSDEKVIKQYEDDSDDDSDDDSENNNDSSDSDSDNSLKCKKPVIKIIKKEE